MNYAELAKLLSDIPVYDEEGNTYQIQTIAFPSTPTVIDVTSSEDIKNRRGSQYAKGLQDFGRINIKHLYFKHDSGHSLA